MLELMDSSARPAPTEDSTGSGPMAVALEILGALGLWLCSIVAGFGGFALAVAGIALAEHPIGWRAIAVTVGVAAALVAFVLQCRSDPRHPVPWLLGSALAVVAGFGWLALLQR